MTKLTGRALLGIDLRNLEDHEIQVRGNFEATGTLELVFMCPEGVKATKQLMGEFKNSYEAAVASLPKGYGGIWMIFEIDLWFNNRNVIAKSRGNAKAHTWGIAANRIPDKTTKTFLKSFQAQAEQRFAEWLSD